MMPRRVPTDRIEDAFRRDWRRRAAEDFRNGWFWIALIIALTGFSIINSAAPKRSLGVERAIVIGGRISEQDEGSFPYADVELANGAIVTISVPRDQLFPNGSMIQVEAFERTWPWQRTTYRYVGRARGEGTQ